MKKLDVIAAVLLVIGGLNWGLVGLFNIDIIASLFGESAALSRTIYAIVGACAVYQAIQQKGIRDRWCQQAA